jgi:hypothetical protein
MKRLRLLLLLLLLVVVRRSKLEQSNDINEIVTECPLKFYSLWLVMVGKGSHYVVDNKSTDISQRVIRHKNWFFSFYLYSSFLLTLC